MTDLAGEYAGHPEWFRFLKQYITLDRSELFFADKAIFIEGDTERILMPTMMKMVDENYPLEGRECNLASQNISIIAVGNYTHIFAKFFNFIGFQKICVITDLDICSRVVKEKDKSVYRAARFSTEEEQYTTNPSLKVYFNQDDDKRIKWSATANKWEQSADGNVMICFQSDIDGYQPRSFEDAFFATNMDYMATDAKVFNGIKQDALEKFKIKKDFYQLADIGIKSKATFAVDLLIDKGYQGKAGYVDWKVPQYILDGLLWLRKD